MTTRKEATSRCKALAADAPPSFETVKAVFLLLGHPDPTVRDGLAYSALGRSILDGKLDEHLEGVIRLLCGELGMRATGEIRETDSAERVPILARSFSCLIAAIVIHRVRALEGDYSRIESLAAELERVATEETDIRSWHSDWGWVHIVAHTSDAIDELFEWEIDQKPARELATSLVTLLLRKQDGAFGFGEYDRVAHALATALLRGRLQVIDIENIVNPYRKRDFEFEAPPESVVDVNHRRALLRALYFKLKRRAPEAVEQERALKLGDAAEQLCMALQP